MNIKPKTQLDKNFEKIDEATNTTLLAVNGAVHALNNSYWALWNLPDDELKAALQDLLNIGKLQEVFEKHYLTATNLNAILDVAEFGTVRAIFVPAREFVIDENGIVDLVVPPAPEPEPEPEPETPVEEPPVEG